jgi:hypothetical protein
MDRRSILQRERPREHKKVKQLAKQTFIELLNYSVNQAIIQPLNNSVIQGHPIIQSATQ